MTMYSRTQPFLMPPFLGTCNNKTMSSSKHQLQKSKITKNKLKNTISINTQEKTLKLNIKSLQDSGPIFKTADEMQWSLTQQSTCMY